MKFEINNDLNNIRFTFHNAEHLFGSLVLSLLFGFWISYGSWFLHEVSDGFKPWYYEFTWDPKQSWLVNKFREQCLYSDKFSLQDVLVWNLAGASIGAAIIFF